MGLGSESKLSLRSWPTSEFIKNGINEVSKGRNKRISGGVTAGASVIHVGSHVDT